MPENKTWYPDDDYDNADWPKKTPDSLSDLGVEIKEEEQEEQE